MDNSQQVYAEASQLLEEGLTKEAYLKFVAAVEISTRRLHSVKFVHQTIVSTPAEYDKLLSTIRSSLTQLEHIIVQTSFLNKSTEMKTSPPPLPPKPIVPPKPALSSKRPVPPLPPLAIITPDLSPSNTARRPRANSSVTFTSASSRSIPFMDEEEEDEEEEEETIMEVLKCSTENSSCMYAKKDSSPLRQRCLQQGRLTPVSPTTATLTAINSSVEDTVAFIDPYDLVPAQTNTGESMALPISPTCTTDLYVPNIPAPPLLGMHRQLQKQLDHLLAQQQQKHEHSPSWVEQEQQTASIATVRRLLNNVRTVYMSAMTVPTILAFSPQLTAYQLTLIESAIFRAIPPEALQQHRAISKLPHANIVASTDFFNYLTRSIEHAILLPQEASHRAEVVHRWIKIATQCLALNNYQTLKAIVSALGTPPIQRLKRTWECIPKKRMARLDVLTALMSEADNYSRYREHIRTLIPNNQPGRQLHQPIVPFLGVLIHDMTYVLTAAGTDDVRIQEILDWMRTFQRCPSYSLRPPAGFTKKRNGFFLRQAQALQQYYTPSKPTTLSNTTANCLTPSADTSHLFGANGSATPSPRSSTITSEASSYFSEPLLSEISIEQQQDSVTLEQQRITHYLLMRPWVNEKIIDELSLLREAPRRGILSSSSCSSSPTSASGHHGYMLARTNSCNSVLSQSTATSGLRYSHSHSHHHDSILSMTTTSSGRSTWDDLPKSPTSPFLLDDPHHHHLQHHSPRKSFGSFWPWRKSGEIHKSGPPSMTSFTLEQVDTEGDGDISESRVILDDVTTKSTAHTPPPTPRRILRHSLTSPHQQSASVPGTAKR